MSAPQNGNLLGLRPVSWRLVQGPQPLLDVEEAKQHLRVEQDDEDLLISHYCAAAQQWAEEYCSRAFVTQSWELVLPGWPAGREIRLPRPPLQGVEWVKWLDDDGVERTMNDAYYFVDTASEPGRILLEEGANWPDSTFNVRGVTVRYTAGYGGPEEVPEPVVQAVRFLVGHYYENRESVVVGSAQGTHVPDTVRALLWPWRVW